MSNRDKELVSLICQDCGKSFSMTFGRYRRLPKDNHWRCKECTNIKRSQIFANLTEDERKKLKEQRSSAAKKVWSDLSFDEYIRRCESQRQRWAKLTKEEKEEIMRNTRIGHAEYMSRPEVKAMFAQMNRDRWNSYSDEERAQELIRLAKIKDDYWDSLTIEQKFNKMMHMWMKNTGVGPTEYIFNDFLKSKELVNGTDYFWGYNTFPYINPEYFDKFGHFNPISGEENIPYHSWDFILFPKSDHPILIDIDGSVHNPKSMMFKRRGNTYTDREKIDFRDSQRPYQIPDGMDAYVVQAHRDRLNEEVLVVNLKTEATCMYSDFTEMLTNLIHQNAKTTDIATGSSTIEGHTND